MDAAIQIKVLHAALLGADKMVPVLDGAILSASKVFSVTPIIVKNQIYESKYVTKIISSFGCTQIIASIGCSVGKGPDLNGNCFIAESHPLVINTLANRPVHEFRSLPR